MEMSGKEIADEKKFISDKLWNEFHDIYPIIHLILYGLSNKDINILMGEGVFYDKPLLKIRFAIALTIGFIKYYVGRLFEMLDKGKTKHSGKKTVYFSESILRSDRYSDLLKVIWKHVNVACGRTYCSERLTKDRQIPFRWTENIYFGEYVLGNRLRKSVRETYNLLMEIQEREESCESRRDDVRKSLERLRRSYNSRLKKVRLILSRHKIDCYVTANQCKIIEVLLTDSFRGLKVKTKEIQHCTRVFWSTDTYKSDTVLPELSYVDEMCFWMDEDLEWIRKYENIKGAYDQKVIFSVCGSVEIIEVEKIKEKCRGKDRNKAILFLPPHLQYIYKKDEIYYEEFEMYKKLLNEFRQFLKNNNLQGIVRFHPQEEMWIRKETANLAHKMGMIVQTDNREELFDGLAESRVCFGESSSVMLLALNYGCAVYGLKCWKDNYDFCSMGVKAVDIEEIKEVTGTITYTRYCKDMFKYQSLY